MPHALGMFHCDSFASGLVEDWSSQVPSLLQASIRRPGNFKMLCCHRQHSTKLESFVSPQVRCGE